jgi:hypothetical protein
MLNTFVVAITFELRFYNKIIFTLPSLENMEDISVGAFKSNKKFAYLGTMGYCVDAQSLWI